MADLLASRGVWLGLASLLAMLAPSFGLTKYASFLCDPDVLDFMCDYGGPALMFVAARLHVIDDSERNDQWTGLDTSNGRYSAPSESSPSAADFSSEASNTTGSTPASTT